MIRNILERQIVRYIFVGGFAFLIEIGILYLLNNTGHLSPTVSVAISFWIGFIVAYILQKIVTFQNKEKTKKALAKQLVGYSILVAWNYGFTLLVVELFQHNLPVVILRTIVIAITTIWNYALYKIIFKSTSK